MPPLHSRPEIWLALPEVSGGWAPVTTMARLLATYWSAELRVFTPQRPYGRLLQGLSLLPRLRGSRPPLLIIAAHPGMLLSLVRPSLFAGRYSRIGAWIIDSFWDHLIPRFARATGHLDHVWITDGELVDTYSSRLRAPVDWAPWGADVLGQMSRSARERPVDVLRLGRQPATWADDAVNQRWAVREDLTYQGRFPAPASPEANHRAVLDQLLRTKVVLASSNLADEETYTHPTREYVTARFTDAAACGALIVGRLPRVQAMQVIPEISRVDVDMTDRGESEETVRAAVTTWTPDLSAQIRREALRSTDWRWRFHDISRTLGIATPTLDRDLAQIYQLTER